MRHPRTPTCNVEKKIKQKPKQTVPQKYMPARVGKAVVDLNVSFIIAINTAFLSFIHGWKLPHSRPENLDRTIDISLRYDEWRGEANDVLVGGFS